MKRKMKKRKAPRYPAAADWTYYRDKILNGILAFVTGVGLFTAMVFLFLM